VPATERVLNYILAEMDAGRLQPGGRVNAARIASNLGLSVAPIREALGVLAGRGVLELHADRGAVMRPLSARDVCHVWELLAPIGGVGLRLAAEAIAAGTSFESLAMYFDAIAENVATATPVELMVRLNEWHYEANRIGGNDFVNITLDRLGVPYWDRYLVHFIDIDAHRPTYLANYRRMHEAVIAGDGGAAVSILEFHARWSIALVRAGEAALPKRKRRLR
jgi:DNA-binding GntR family transcriptional regulator